MTSPLLTDPRTVIGRSDPYNHGAPPPALLPIAGGGLPPYPNTAALAPWPVRPPPDFPFGPATRREVRTEILNFDLRASGWGITAGQAFYNSVAGVGLQALYKNSFGIAASKDAGGDPLLDFPADSFFDVFVEAQVPSPGGPFRTYNLTPMVLRSQLTQFPPDFSLPQSNYIHDPRFPAVPLFSADCLQVGWLLSAGHGGPDIEALTRAAGPAALLIGPSSAMTFNVAREAHGLPETVSPVNHVRDDYSLPIQQTTLYTRTGGYTNARKLVGVGFQPGDTINGQTFGHDSTRGPGGEPFPGVLYFSVARGSLGAEGSDVRAAHDAPCPREAQGVFVWNAPAFGNFAGRPGAAPVPAGSNYLAADGSTLGLGTHGAVQDELTDFILEPYTGEFRWFGAMSGPSFPEPGDAATLWMYDPASGPFGRANLISFAPPAELGLSPDDVISALAASMLHTQSQDPLQHDPGDRVLFALRPGSPTLAALGMPPATVFQSDFSGSITVFATSDMLWLNPDDIIDGLDIMPLPGPGGVVLLGLAGFTIGRRRI